MHGFEDDYVGREKGLKVDKHWSTVQLFMPC